MKSIIKVLVVMLLIVSLAGFASAYSLECYSKGEIMFGTVECTSDCCKVCVTDSGHHTNINYCIDAPDCSCDDSGSDDSPEIEPDPTPCDEEWECSDWGECIGGKKTRTCWDENNCGTTKDKPDTTEDCHVPASGSSGGSTATTPQTCTPEWECGEWTRCFPQGIQTRVCVDRNDCNTLEGRPIEHQTCVYEADEDEKPHPEEKPVDIEDSEGEDEEILGEQAAQEHQEIQEQTEAFSQPPTAFVVLENLEFDPVISLAAIIVIVGIIALGAVITRKLR